MFGIEGLHTLHPRNSICHTYEDMFLQLQLHDTFLCSKSSIRFSCLCNLSTVFCYRIVSPPFFQRSCCLIDISSHEILNLLHMIESKVKTPPIHSMYHECTCYTSGDMFQQLQLDHICLCLESNIRFSCPCNLPDMIMPSHKS